MLINEVEIKQLRSFGLMVGGIFVLIGLWPALLRGEDPRLWLLIFAGFLMIPALLFPRILKPAYRIWMATGQILGWVNTRIILGVVFYGLFLPTGLIMRLLGKDSMRLKLEEDTDSYRVVRQARPNSHMKHQF